MDYSTFDEKVTKKDILLADEEILDDSVLKGTVKFSDVVNSEEDLTIGSCPCASITFDLRRIDALPDITGKELIWKKGANTQTNSYEDFAGIAKPLLAVIVNDRVYVASSRAPYLSVWDLSLMTQFNIEFEQPSGLVEAMIAIDGDLYCIKSDEIITYDISGETPIIKNTPDLTVYQQWQMQYAKNHSKSVYMNGDVLHEFRVDFFDGKPIDLIEQIFEFVQMGIFIADKPEKNGNSVLSATAYDRMSRFDRDVSEWYKEIQFPITLANLTKSLCDHIGVACDLDFLNSDYSIQHSFDLESISGRDFLSCIAEVACSFARFDREGILRLEWYQQIDYTVHDKGQCYSEVKVAEYSVKPIDRLQVKATQSDIGVIIPETGNNTYVIEDNPLLYTQTEEEITPVMQNILNRLILFPAYYPIEIEINGNPLLNAGDIIQFVDASENTYLLPIMNRTMGNNDILISTGNAEREENTDVNRSIIALRGKTNELTRTLDETVLLMGNLEENLSNEIRITADGLTEKITNAEGNISTLQTTAQGLQQQVTSTDQTVTTLKSDVEGFSTTFATQEGVTQEISSALNGISLSVDNRDSYSRIAINVNGVQVGTTERIEFTGDVVFASDLTDGVTEISGDNIQTGNIDLDVVTLSNGYGSFSAASGSTGATGTQGARMTGSSDDIYIIVTNAACRMTADGNDFYVSVNTIHADIAIDVGSDERIKKDVEYDLSDRYMDFYRKLKPARYKMIDGTSNRYHTGFVAQDIKSALEESGLSSQDLAALIQVDYDPLAAENNGMYSVRYEEMIALNTAMIQQLMEKIDNLESEIRFLKGE